VEVQRGDHPLRFRRRPHAVSTEITTLQRIY
jgi:hypothetical protein